jgi:hypothetical protein
MRSDRYLVRRQGPEGDATTVVVVVAIIGGGLALLGLGAVFVVVMMVVLAARSVPAPPGPPPAVAGGPNPAPPQVIPGDTHAFVRQAVQANNLKTVATGGFNANDKGFRDVPPEGAILIGFEAGLKPFLGTQVVNSLRPIYLTKDGEKTGPWCGPRPAQSITMKAKAGYVVSAVNVRTGALLDGFSLEFARLAGGRLQLDDTYESVWVGGEGGGPDRLGGAGALYVGVCGNLTNENEPCNLGLVTLTFFQE